MTSHSGIDLGCVKVHYEWISSLARKSKSFSFLTVSHFTVWCNLKHLWYCHVDSEVGCDGCTKDVEDLVHMKSVFMCYIRSQVALGDDDFIGVQSQVLLYLHQQYSTYNYSGLHRNNNCCSFLRMWRLCQPSLRWPTASGSTWKWKSKEILEMSVASHIIHWWRHKKT